MTGNKKYSELTIIFDNKNYEQICNTLYLFNVKNILEENSTFKIYFSEQESNKILKIKTSLLSGSVLKSKNISVKQFADKDWTKEWKNTIQPVFVQDKIIIYPSWKRKEVKKYKDRILIELDPKMSFGTGHNETTILVISMMCDYLTREDKRMLDYGSGTGMLSIAGIKLGLKEAVAIDTDEDSIRDSGEYIRRNGLKNKIKIYKKNISEIKESEFDVICANIILSVISDNINFIFQKTKPSGKIFLSGILKTEENKIKKVLQKNSFKISDIKNSAEWIGNYAKKNES